MMKKYIDQIYNEGLGTTLYIPIEKKLNNINKESLRKIFIKIYRVLYFIFAIVLAIIILYYEL